MAFNVTKTSKELASQIAIKPNLIVEIEGVDLVFSAVPIFKQGKWDDNVNWDDPEVFWDGLIEMLESRAYIDFTETTKTITQQIILDKGGSSSVSSMNVQIVNKDMEVSKVFSFDKITEILGKKANVYLNWAEGSHPEDSLPLFRGFIDDYGDLTSSVVLSISHSENHKRQSFLDQYNSKLTKSFIYKDLLEQDISYSQRDKSQENLNIEYIAGSPLSVSILGNDITVVIEPTTTADEIVKEIRETSEVNFVVLSQVSGTGTDVQVVFAKKSFTLETNIEVESTNGLLETQDIIRTYLRLNDEIVEVLNIVDDNNIEVSRSKLNSLGQTHDLGDDLGSIYRIQGLPHELSLKIMLSEGGNEFFESNETIESFNFIDDDTFVQNSIIFSNLNIEEHTGLVEGDFVKITGSLLNDGEYTILGFLVLEDGRSLVVVDGNIQTETDSSPTFLYKSKYDVLKVGLGMQPNEVDVAGFEEINDTFGTNFVDYDFKIEETIDNAKDFIDKEVLFPQGIYSIPRKARSSAKFTAPPLSIETIPVFNSDTITNLKVLRQKRSIHQYFYNNIGYVYDHDVLFDKFKASRYFISELSFSRIKKVGNKTLKIENKGLVDNDETNVAIDRIQERFIDRYRFAARFIPNVQVLYKVGYRLEIGDTVQFGGEDTKLTNLQSGERDFPVKLFELVNKKLDAQSAIVKFDLLETGFSIENVRYGVFSPASLVGSGSTKERIILDKFLNDNSLTFEREKWVSLVGAKLVVRNEDYSFFEEVDFLGLDQFNSEAISISELTVLPTEGFFVELADYDKQPINEDGDFVKLKYTFRSLSSLVTVAIDESTFNTDTTGLKTGQFIQIHSEDFARDSERVEIFSVIFDTVTLVSPLEFVPQVGDIMETHTFESDNGDGYFFQ